MNLASTEQTDALLLELYSAEDLGAFYKIVARTLTERFAVGDIAIHMLDRRRQRFLEYESRPGIGADENLRSFPLRVRGGDLGLLSVDGDLQDDTEHFELLCGHIALGLYYHKFIDQQGQLIDESLAHVQALKAMGELLGELDQELVLNKTLKFFVDLLDADVGAAVLSEGDRSIAFARWGLPEDVLDELISAVHAGQMEEEGITQRVLLPKERFDTFSLGSVLRLPVELKPPFSAQLFLVSGEYLDVSAHQRELMRSCSVIGGIAMQKALDHQQQIREHRLNEQLAVAKEIQAKMLPDTLPQTRHLQIAGLSLPALAVGGDYYDVLEMENGDLLAIVADVSGKGIQAAIRMSGLQAMMHSLVFQDIGPGEVLERLNHFLGTSRLRGHFITACCLRFEAGGGRLRLASAGHEPVILSDTDGSTRLVEEVGGLPLGLRGDQVYEEIQLELSDGGRLFLYTDGVTDVRNGFGELFGSDRLVTRIINAGRDSAQDVLDGLVSELETFRGEISLPDDLTALTFHYRIKGDG